ncbi:MAG TPA: hypothetical protein VMH34_04215 [Gammaproteobacteria bacterium]|nr:hypothetical protein [Gammaproteobacteria bacterium]
MAQLNQIQCRYIPMEDRVLLRINSSDHSEFRFWLTRRYIRLLWPVLSQLLQGDPQISQTSDPRARQAILAFQHESALSQSSFSQTFREDQAKFPLGEAPVLLARIQTKTTTQGQSILCLHPEQGQGIELNMNRTLLHALTRLLTDAVQKAGWELELSVPPPATSAPEQITIN